MPLTNAQLQARHRQRKADRLAALSLLAQAVLVELADAKGDKGKRLHAMAQAALNG